jgi:hypothetical protein
VNALTDSSERRGMATASDMTEQYRSGVTVVARTTGGQADGAVTVVYLQWPRRPSWRPDRDSYRHGSTMRL